MAEGWRTKEKLGLGIVLGGRPPGGRPMGNIFLRFVVFSVKLPRRARPELLVNLT